MIQHIDRMKTRAELIRIKQWFKDIDWKVNKIITGEWDNNNQNWIDYKEARTKYRNRQDDINSMLIAERRSNAKKEKN